MGKKLGNLIRSARTDAGLTQEQLAKKVEDMSASELGCAERGEKEPSTEQLKQIAKATGVTQKSLLEAAKAEKGKSGKTGSGKTGSAKSEESMKLTAAERKLVELYRAADKTKRERALKILQGEGVDLSTEGLLGAALDALMKK